MKEIKRLLDIIEDKPSKLHDYMLEEFNTENGEVKSENFDTYLLPTIKDIPPITVIPVENHDKAGPLGAKVLGEPVLELGAAALNNAVSFALNKPTMRYRSPWSRSNWAMR